MSSLAGHFRTGNRLKRPEEFKQVFSSSKCHSSDQSFLFLARKNGLNQARLGLSVPNKYIKKAVNRNRLKRIIRENFRLRQERLKGNDIVIVVRGSVDVKCKMTGSVISRHWEKLVNETYLDKDY